MDVDSPKGFDDPATNVSGYDSNSGTTPEPISNPSQCELRWIESWSLCPPARAKFPGDRSRPGQDPRSDGRRSLAGAGFGSRPIETSSPAGTIVWVKSAGWPNGAKQ